MRASSRPILVENPAACIAFTESTIPDAEFLAELPARTGCGLLLDVNNLYVLSVNLGFDRSAWLDAIPVATIGDLHLAGHARMTGGGEELLIDDHGSAVGEAVMGLYADVLEEEGRAQRLLDVTIQALKMPDVHSAG